MDDFAGADPARQHLSPQGGGGGGQQPPVPRSPTPLDLSASAYHNRRLSPSPRPPAHPQARLPSPYGQIPPAGHHHARSLSQPLFFSLDSLPPPPP
jgi:hypothetical protein